jgi:uncharacterized protein YggE
MDIRLNHKHFIALAGVAVAPWLIAATIEATTSADNATRIDIVGYGSAPQPVQLLTMSAGVETFDTSASAAMTANSTAVAAIRRDLARYGVAANDVRSSQLSLQPSSRSDDSDPGRSIKGFRVVHTLTVTFRDVGKTGAVMDTLVAAGANQINGPRFSSEARPEILGPARLAAIRDAEQRAQFYARALGMKVKRVVTMHDGGGYATPQPALMRLDVRSGTDLAPGQDQVQVSVVAQYELTR